MRRLAALVSSTAMVAALEIDWPTAPLVPLSGTIRATRWRWVSVGRLEIGGGGGGAGGGAIGAVLQAARKARAAAATNLRRSLVPFQMGRVHMRSNILACSPSAGP